MPDQMWVLVGLAAVAAVTHRGLRGWRRRRRVAWEQERAVWRAWISRA